MIISENSLVAAGSANVSTGGDPNYYTWQYGTGWALRIDTETGIILDDKDYNDVSVFNSVLQLVNGGFIFAAVKNINTTEPYWFSSSVVKTNERLQF